jgi:hypothetical protein
MAAIKDIVLKDISPNAPAYENNIRSKMPGYNVVFAFPTCPVPEENTLSFPAYVKSVTDTFTPSFEASKQIYGRMDPIPVYSRTTRTIQFDLELPSFGLEHSREISDKLNILTRNTYPTYRKYGSVNIISSPPLVEIFFSSFIADIVPKTTTSNTTTSSPATSIGARGLLGHFSSPITIKHDIDANGVFVRNGGYEAYAKAYSLSFSINVLHKYTPGYINGQGQVKSEVNILRGIR